MAMPTPKYNLDGFPNVYQPSEDTFLMLDALELDISFIKSLGPSFVAEIGSGSGIAITFLASALKNLYYLATDINGNACSATLKTANINNVNIECVNMNLLDNFKNNLFDIIVFNPPYVVTQSAEVYGTSLNRAWAGGKNGREIIDKFLQKLPNMLSSNSVCYMVAIKENDVNEIMRCMLDIGLNAVIMTERKILGEYLFILKFSRSLGMPE